MRTTIRTLACVVVAAVVGACGPAKPAPAEMEAAAAALDQQFLDAYNKGDADALTATYWNSPDVVSFSPDGMGSKGWEAVKAANAATFKGGPAGKLEFTSLNNRAVGEVVLGWGTWRLTVPPADTGAPMVLEGRYTDVKALRDGKWVYLMDHASVPLPPPPPAPAAPAATP